MLKAIADGTGESGGSVDGRRSKRLHHIVLDHHSFSPKLRSVNNTRSVADGLAFGRLRASETGMPRQRTRRAGASKLKSDEVGTDTRKWAWAAADVSVNHANVSRVQTKQIGCHDRRSAGRVFNTENTAALRYHQLASANTHTHVHTNGWQITATMFTLLLVVHGRRCGSVVRMSVFGQQLSRPATDLVIPVF